MNEYLLEAREELKRLEHIIYVSLKYTRTVDVILNAVHRLMSTYDWIIEAFLEEAKKKGTIEALPKTPPLRKKKLEELYPDDKEMLKYLAFYAFLKTVLSSTHTKREEYRRHVALVVELNNTDVEINIDNLLNCERFVHQFFNYAWEKIVGKREED